jgi:hypothetical protein
MGDKKPDPEGITYIWGLGEIIYHPNGVEQHD